MQIRDHLKRGLVIALSVALAFPTAPVSAFAAETGAEVEGEVASPTAGVAEIAASESARPQADAANKEESSEVEDADSSNDNTGNSADLGEAAGSNQADDLVSSEGEVDSEADAGEKTSAKQKEQESDNGDEAVESQTEENEISLQDLMAAPMFARASTADSTFVSLGSTVSGMISDGGVMYRFSLPSGGSVTLTGKAGFSARFYLYDANSSQLDSWSSYFDDVSGQATFNSTFYLTKGTYYIAIGDWWDGTSTSYSFKLAFSSSNESFSENQGGSNNSLSAASKISLGTSYNAQLAKNDTQDFFRLELESAGRLSIRATLYPSSTRIFLYDRNGNQLKSGYYYKDGVTGRCDVSENIDLTKGTYYIAFSQNDEYGRYTFSTSFSTSGESFSEAQNGSNNSYDSAQEISAGTTYKGQLALNDEYDFYKFNTNSAGRVNLSATTYMDVRLHLYDSSGDEVNGGWYYANGVTGRCEISEAYDLSKGTYYLCFQRNGTGNYSFNISGSIVGSSKLPAPGNVKVSAVSPSGVKLTWSKVSGAAGYVVMRADGASGSSFKEVGNISSGSTTSFTDKSASTGKTYSYSVIAFTKSGSTYTRGTWAGRKTIKTAPVAPKISSASRTSSGVKLSWSKVGGADGYVVMRRNAGSGSYSKIASLSSGSTVSYTDKSASASKSYDYSVIGYVKNGSTYTRGSWASKKTVSTSSSKLPAPGNVKVSAVSPSGVKLTWSKVSGAAGYVVMRADGASGSTFKKVGNITSGSTTSFTDKSASAGKTYSYSVIAFKMSGSNYIRGNWASRRTVKTAPAAPKISGVYGSQGGVMVMWSKSTGADGYVIMRKGSNESSYKKIATVSSSSTYYYDTTGVKGRKYSYSVIGYVKNGSIYTRGHWASHKDGTAY